MTGDHADFYLGAGPDTRWLGSLADVGRPDHLADLDTRAGRSATTGVLSALDSATYEAAVAGCLATSMPLRSASDLNRGTIQQITLSLLAPGPAPNLYELPEGVSFADERVVAAFDFLVDADRYAEGNNPERGHELLTSAATIATQAVTAHHTHQPYPWPPR